MIRRPPRSTLSSSSAASDVYKRQVSTQSTGVTRLTMRAALRVTQAVCRTRRAIPAQRWCSTVTVPDESPDVTSFPIPAHVTALAEQIVQLNLLEASQLNDVLKERLGISDVPMGMPMAAGPAAAAGAPVAEAVEEQTEFEIILEGFDASSKIKVIKEVRAVAGLGLKEAKELVEGSPKSVKAGLSKEEAEAIKAKLEELGGKVTLK
eukprot:TRINITY_DN49620_c0_g1_i2.p1 TRINITY_DN49620_c0_g1~~TRINITY_DN49620_c0_g1_i2.p1  ORF type:complete len:207 (+),score=60.30 TRINITY_DN49620_c0_g1_i2:92-712(+)